MNACRISALTQKLAIGFVAFVILVAPIWAQSSNQVLGEVELVGATGVEKSSGVWIDGQYLGYLKELNGSKLW